MTYLAKFDVKQAAKNLWARELGLVQSFSSRSARTNEANVTVAVTEDHAKESPHHMKVNMRKPSVTSA
jgi:hypothetical protein